LKICSVCKKEKDYSEFCKNKSTKDGYHGQCKECHNQKNKEWRKQNPDKEKIYRERNKEKHALYAKEWDLKNPEKRREAREKWKQNNPELYKEVNRKSYYKPENYKKKKEYNKQWAKDNPEKVREKNREWFKKNKEKRIKYNNIRKARKRKTMITPINYKKILERDNWICQYCGVKTSKNLPLKHDRYTTFDHVIPLCKGGTETEDNIVVACYKCNCIIKRGKLIEEVTWEEDLVPISK
jgi:hypothetical protein